MKTITILILLFTIASFSWAEEWETYDLVHRLILIREPGAPIIHENAVIFTVSSNLRRAGIAFAHENFSTVYWFRDLLLSQDRRTAPIPPGQKFPNPYGDSGVRFHVQPIPENLKEFEYRIVIDGLWSVDPWSPQTRRDPVTGLTMSVLPLPAIPVKPSPLNGLPEGLLFSFTGPPGEIITVAGNFNGWDPFMYELSEGPAGHYNITIPLPSGTYQYVFFYRGRRFTDPHNAQRAYARDGSAASVIVVP